VKCLLAGDNVTALFLLRNEMSKFPEHFAGEQRQLSQLFLCKSKKDLIKESGLDVNNKLFLEEYLKNLEQKGDSEDNENGDSFDEWVKRYLVYEILNCPFHKKNSHSLIRNTLSFKSNGTSKSIKNGSGSLTINDIKTPNNKTKKISKKESNNSFKKDRKRRRMRHMCQPSTFNLETKQLIKNIADQVWRVKLSKDGKYFVVSTKNMSLYSYKQK
jgi:hypothetical protein